VCMQALRKLYNVCGHCNCAHPAATDHNVWVDVDERMELLTNRCRHTMMQSNRRFDALCDFLNKKTNDADKRTNAHTNTHTNTHAATGDIHAKNVFESVVRVAKASQALLDLDCPIFVIIKQFARTDESLQHTDTHSSATADTPPTTTHSAPTHDDQLSTASGIVSTIIRVCGFLNELTLLTFVHDVCSQPLSVCVRLAQMFAKSEIVCKKAVCVDAVRLLKEDFLRRIQALETQQQQQANTPQRSSLSKLFAAVIDDEQTHTTSTHSVTSTHTPTTPSIEQPMRISSLSLELWCSWLYAVSELCSKHMKANIEHVCTRLETVGLFAHTDTHTEDWNDMLHTYEMYYNSYLSATSTQTQTHTQTHTQAASTSSHTRIDGDDDECVFKDELRDAVRTPAQMAQTLTTWGANNVIAEVKYM
jgi:DNA segregation ATPase FtsK/SpoIIIE-like protein